MSQLQRAKSNEKQEKVGGFHHQVTRNNRKLTNSEREEVDAEIEGDSGANIFQEICN